MVRGKAELRGIYSLAPWVSFPSHDPDSLNLSKRTSECIPMSEEFGDLGEELKLELHNLWMSDHPCLYHVPWTYPNNILSLQQSSESYRLYVIDHDKQTKTPNTCMTQTIYHSIICNIKRLDTHNPNIHPWELVWLYRNYSYIATQMKFYAAVKKMRTISFVAM